MWSWREMEGEVYGSEEEEWMVVNPDDQSAPVKKRIPARLAAMVRER